MNAQVAEILIKWAMWMLTLTFAGLTVAAVGFVVWHGMTDEAA